jgi:probable biosynthetic protein (TIGR04098 family)
MTDANGERLYATFTRIRFECSDPLTTFSEDSEMTATGTLSRYGSNYFFSDLLFSAGDREIRARLMSTFTKRAQEGSNAALLKGQPVIPSDCPVPALAQQPEFAGEFREHRLAHQGETLFATDYALRPCHDINGVNLLYFAAYPSINDLCELDGGGHQPGWALRRSTIARDIFYSANCDVNDPIRYRLHERTATGDAEEARSTLTRAPDGRLMAYVVTRRALLEP